MKPKSPSDWSARNFFRSVIGWRCVGARQQGGAGDLPQDSQQREGAHRLQGRVPRGQRVHNYNTLANTEAESKENVVSYFFLSMGPYAAVDYNNLTLCPLQNRLYNTFTMGIPMPESTLSPSQGLWIWPQEFGFVS